MKNTISLQILLMLLTTNIYLAYAQSPNFLWAQRSGGTDLEISRSITIDRSGNSIITGSFQGITSFSDTTLTSAGNWDIFVVKNNENGQLIKAQRFGGTLRDGGRDIASDNFCNFFVTGYFQDSITFGDTMLTGLGSNDIFLAKFDSDCNVVWVLQAGGQGDDAGLSIAIDGLGNSIITGIFSETAIFGDTTLTSVGSKDIFIAKYDCDGNFLWVRQAGGIEEDTGSEIIADISGNVLITGSFRSTGIFGDTTLSSVGSADIYVAKYNSDGDFNWVQQAGGVDFDWGDGVVVDKLNNIIITGAFEGVATFSDTILSSLGNGDIFISKYDSTGNLIWAQKAGGFDDYIIFDLGEDIAIDYNNNYIVTGYFLGSAIFGDTTLTSVGISDIFIAKYDEDGKVVWVLQAGGQEGSGGLGIATDGFGNIIVTGHFSGTAAFGDTILTCVGSSDIFLTKIGEEIVGIQFPFFIPNAYLLYQNYPNPFNPTTTIKYTLPKTEKVKIEVFNLLGQKVTTLLNNQIPSGSHEVEFIGKDLPSGVYLYRIEAGEYQQVRKMILLK